MQQAVEVGPNTTQFHLRSNHFECRLDYQNRETLLGGVMVRPHILIQNGSGLESPSC